MEPAYIACWKQGKKIVIDDGTDISFCCLKCGKPVAKKYDRTLAWHPAWVFFLALAGVLLFLIVAVILRKQCRIKVGLCELHARRRRTYFIIGWSSFATALLLFAVAVVVSAQSARGSNVPGMLGFAGLLLLLFSAGWAIFVSRSLITPSKINERRRGWLNGAGEPLLRHLGEYPWST